MLWRQIKEVTMKYLVPLIFILSGCSTFNASVDGAQDIVNITIAATGEGVAGVTTAVGKDVSDTITYVTNSAADGVRAVTSPDEDQ